jgi:hypothetical protein
MRHVAHTEEEFGNVYKILARKSWSKWPLVRQMHRERVIFRLSCRNTMFQIYGLDSLCSLCEHCNIQGHYFHMTAIGCQCLFIYCTNVSPLS